jgi:hypothetical protein
MRTAGLLVLCLALAACAAPSDIFDQGSPPSQPPQNVLIERWGNPPQNALATVFADLRGQFVFETNFGRRLDNISLTNPPGLADLMRFARSNVPRDTLVVMVTDQPLPPATGRGQTPRHGVVWASERVMMASTVDIKFDSTPAGPNLVSKMVLHMFGHALGIHQHFPDRFPSLMNDWRDDLGRLKHLPEDYDPRSLSRLSQWLRTFSEPAGTPIIKP